MSGVVEIWRRVLAVILLSVLIAGPAQAQQPSRVNPTADSVKEQQLLDALKPGGPGAVSGRITIPDTRAGTLIQPAGRDWRTWRDTTMPRIGMGAILGMLAALIVFFVVRGRVRVDGGLAGQTVTRFSELERFGHWLTATSFVVLAVTGLNVTYGRQYVLPFVGAETFTLISQWAKYLHNYMSFAFVLGLVIIFARWVAFNLPLPRDFVWVAQGGGIFGKKHPPAGKFNAGQKVMFWITVLGGFALAVTGYAMMFPYYQLPAGVPGDVAGKVASYTATIDGLQTLTVIHGVVGLVMIAAILAHIYIGTIGMEGAFWSMGSGKVDANWARQHHSLWADRVLPKEKKGAVPAE